MMSCLPTHRRIRFILVVASTQSLRSTQQVTDDGRVSTTDGPSLSNWVTVDDGSVSGEEATEVETHAELGEEKSKDVFSLIFLWSKEVRRSKLTTLLVAVMASVRLIIPLWFR